MGAEWRGLPDWAGRSLAGRRAPGQAGRRAPGLAGTRWGAAGLKGAPLGWGAEWRGQPDWAGRSLAGRRRPIPST
ncbi:hypothetical protein GCM10027258_65980 [Amycolatopsis stemonae]